jgi:ATP-binding cassette subfamily A (ABC1) protein 1
VVDLRARILKDPEVSNGTYLIDEDVQHEATEVETGEKEGDLIVIRKLKKVYKTKGDPKLAVKGLEFSIPQGECFGFLGVNGAGKTTTLKMLTGDVIPTSGTASLAGHDILKEQLQVRRVIGYCPQFDALLENLTVKEHLELFAKIKGIPENLVGFTVREKMDQLNLNAFENKLAGKLSGGNKRKLSVAIAMIGSPPVVFLDEPSTGMDPLSRRFMWNMISCWKMNRSIMLTTHSMEECEALCTRVGVMAAGRLHCLGSIQHVKSRFGKGLQIQLKVKNPQNAEQERYRIANLLQSQFGPISTTNLKRVCETLGDPLRRNWVCTVFDGRGWMIENIKKGEIVLPEKFAEWWVEEDVVQKIDDFMKEKFSNAKLVEEGAVKLLERHCNQIRYQLEVKLSLADVFEVIESQKLSLGIAEYSVSQKSLEQIFNEFAMKHEPAGIEQ